MDETLVNAEIARAGYGIAVLFEPNDRYYDDVKAAQDQAQAAGAGLYDEATGCTVPAQVSAFQAATEQAVAAPVGGDVAALEGRIAELAALGATGTALADVLDKPHGVPALALTGGLGEGVKAQLADARTSIRTAGASVVQARDAELQRLEEERRAAEEAARRAAEEAARVAAEEAARQAAEQAARQAAEEAAAERAQTARNAAEAPATTHGAAGAFANCSEARAAGAAPVRLGDPGYSAKLDRDGDGVGCES